MVKAAPIPLSALSEEQRAQACARYELPRPARKSRN